MMNLKEIDENVKHLYTRVVSCCISWMLQKESTLTRKLILEKLMQPFLKISKPEIGLYSIITNIFRLTRCRHKCSILK